MTARYEIWILTAGGERIHRVNRYFFLNYSRITTHTGTCQLGLPFKDIGDIYQADQRLEIWRAPSEDTVMRMDAFFFLRSKKIYQRQGDDSVVYELRGIAPVNLLDRRIVPFGAADPDESEITATFADNGMKEIVRRSMGASAVDPNRNLEATGLFSIQDNVSAGPTVTFTLINRNLLEAFSELFDATVQLDNVIYFDIVPLSGAAIQFQTFQGLRGQDLRETALAFAVENGNMVEPYVEVNQFEERNFIYTRGRRRERRGRGDGDREGESIWNRHEMHHEEGNRRENTPEQDDVIREELDRHKPVRRLFAKFLNSPGGRGQPRSLYGLDWDLGDRVRASFAGEQYEPVIDVVYVALKEDGTEDVNARTGIAGTPANALSS